MLYEFVSRCVRMHQGILAVCVSSGACAVSSTSFARVWNAMWAVLECCKALRLQANLLSFVSIWFACGSDWGFDPAMVIGASSIALR